MLKYLKISCLVFVLFLGLVFIWVYRATNYTVLKTERVEIQNGQSTQAIAGVLEQHGIVKSALVFEWYVRFKGLATDLKPGEYEFQKNHSLKHIVQQIVSGRTVRYQITIPEGYNIYKICDAFAEKDLMPKPKCLTLVKSPEKFLKDSTNITTLEGYLYPETYFFEKNTTPEQMIEAMVKQFYKVVTPKLIKRAEKQGLSLQEWVTFASLIEKETGLAKERPLIAGVFHNRLKKGMMLQTDPSVIYGIKDFDGNLTRVHLQTDTPYNTYTRKGLPKGPIANPGKASLLAVIEPAQTEAYYFVAKGGGAHYFSKNLSQHNQAVRYYILKVGAKPGPGEEEKF